MNDQLLGGIATASSIFFAAIGLPAQIRKIYKSKSTDGLSLFTQITLLWMASSWAAYALAIKNWFILVSNIPGVVCAVILLVQFWIYRKRRAER